MPTTQEQFANILLNDAARRRVGLTLTDAEAAAILADHASFLAWYAYFLRTRPPAPALDDRSRVSAPTAAPPAGYSVRSAPVTAGPVPASQSLLEERPALVVALAAAALSLLAVAPLPYEFYIFLRWALSGTAVYLGVMAVRSKHPLWLLGIIPMFILWAPAAFIVLERGVWAGLNLAAVVFFVLIGLLLRGPTWPRPDGKARWRWWQIAALAFGITLVISFVGIPTGGGIDCDMSYERSGTLCN